jgi:hypothetical protein
MGEFERGANSPGRLLLVRTSDDRHVMARHKRAVERFDGEFGGLELAWDSQRCRQRIRVVVRLAAIASVAALSAVVLVPGAGGAVPACARSRFARPPFLPAPIRIATTCAVYTVFPGGRGVAVAPRRRPLGAGIGWMQIAGPGAAVVQHGGRIAVLRDGREVFRSAGRFRAAGVFALVGRRAVAFSYEDYSRGDGKTAALYVAPFLGREREVASGERPLGWTRDGKVLTWRFQAGLVGVYLRTSAGALIGRVGGRLREIRFDPSSRSVLALSRSGLLERYDGRWQRVADLGVRGFGEAAVFEPLGGRLIGVLENGHVAVFRGGGSLFASASFPRRRTVSVAGESGLVANASGTVVAFAVTIGDNGGGGGPGREKLYLLHAGDRRASIFHSGRLDFVICERSVNLAWNDDWLLYATPEGKTLLLDSRASGGRVDLTGLVRRLAPIDSEGKINAAITWANASAAASGLTS